MVASKSNGIELHTPEYSMYSGSFNNITTHLPGVVALLHKALDYADTLTDDYTSTDKLKYIKALKNNRMFIAYIVNKQDAVVALSVCTLGGTEMIKEHTTILQSRLVYSTDSEASKLIPYLLSKIALQKHATLLVVDSPRKGFDSFVAGFNGKSSIIYRNSFEIKEPAPQAFTQIENTLL